MIYYTKLNHRHANYPKWRYMIQFERTRNGFVKRHAMSKFFIQIYGHWCIWDKSLQKYVYSEHWAVDTNRNRIVFVEESTITAILLLK